MLKNWMHDIALALRARSGLTGGFFVWLMIILLAALTAFAFLCVAAYDWLSLQLGSIYAALAIAGFFILVALIGALVAAIARRRARERAILERAARAQSASSWLLDPKILGAALQAGRTLGWQRIIPVALLAFVAAQWLRERGEQKSDDAS
jgi:Ca2+/Na+ antiporter